MTRAMLLLVAILLIPACNKKKDDRDDLNPQGTSFMTPMGYTVYFRGGVDVPAWDYFLSHPDYCSRDRALVAVDWAVEAFISRHALNPDHVRSTLRTWKFGLVDDYVFGFGAHSGDLGYQHWASGLTNYENRSLVLALWTRGTTQYSASPVDPDPVVAGVPVNAPPHTIRAPGTYAWWRYGREAFVPAMNYELENVFLVPH